MANIIFSCPLCKNSFNAPALFSGKTVKCPKCEELVSLPPNMPPTGAESSSVDQPSDPPVSLIPQPPPQAPEAKRPTAPSQTPPPVRVPPTISNISPPPPPVPAKMTLPDPPSPRPDSATAVSKSTGKIDGYLIMACPLCVKKFQLAQADVGQKVACPHCHKPILTSELAAGSTAATPKTKPDMDSASTDIPHSPTSKDTYQRKSATREKPPQTGSTKKNIANVELFAPGFSPIGKSEPAQEKKTEKITSESSVSTEETKRKTKRKIPPPQAPTSLTAETDGSQKAKSGEKLGVKESAEKPAAISTVDVAPPTQPKPPALPAPPNPPNPDTEITEGSANTPPLKFDLNPPSAPVSISSTTAQETAAIAVDQELTAKAPVTNIPGELDRADDDPSVAEPAAEQSPSNARLLALLPPKFIDPSIAERKKNKVLIPNALGGFVEIDPNVTKVKYKGAQYEIKSEEKKSTRLSRLVWRLVVFLVCVGLILATFFLLQ